MSDTTDDIVGYVRTGIRCGFVTVLAGVLPLRVPAHAGGGSTTAGSGANRTGVLIVQAFRFW